MSHYTGAYSESYYLLIIQGLTRCHVVSLHRGILGVILSPLNYTGAYSESRGIKIVRSHVAEFISKRDGFPCSYNNIYLVNGASEGIKNMLFIVMGDQEIENKKTGIMVPLPQYPLYSAAIAQLNAKKVRGEKRGGGGVGEGW